MVEVLDACCGSRMFWFDKEDPRALFMDNRTVDNELLCDNRRLTVNPDIVADFTDMPFEDELFSLVVFDPPHLLRAGPNSWLAKKYGKLDESWPTMLHDGFAECMRVLCLWDICWGTPCDSFKSFTRDGWYL